MRESYHCVGRLQNQQTDSKAIDLTPRFHYFVTP